jgi:hypothetical protein
MPVLAVLVTENMMAERAQGFRPFLENVVPFMAIHFRVKLLMYS